MSTAPFNWAGKLIGNPKPRVLPCGHVQLIEGMDRTTVEFEDAHRYMEDLQRQLSEALDRVSGKQ